MAVFGWRVVEKGDKGDPGAPGDLNATYVTATDQTGNLANSRRLVAGSGVTLDMSVAGQIAIAVSGGSGGSGEAQVADGTVTLGGFDSPATVLTYPKASLASNASYKARIMAEINDGSSGFVVVDQEYGISTRGGTLVLADNLISGRPFQAAPSAAGTLGNCTVSLSVVSTNLVVTATRAAAYHGSSTYYVQLFLVKVSP